MIRYGAETYTLTDLAGNALQLFNARHLAEITGREIADDYRTPTYDLMHEIHKTRVRWLGHILRMDPSSHLHRTIKDLHQNNYPGSLISSTPAHTDFNALLSTARDRDLWRAFVRSLPSSHNSLAPSGGVK